MTPGGLEVFPSLDSLNIDSDTVATVAAAGAAVAAGGIAANAINEKRKRKADASLNKLE